VAKLALLAVSALAVAVAAATVAAPAGTTTTATTCGKLLPPSWGSYLGAFADLDTREMYGTAPAAGGRISAFEELSRHRLAWVSISQEWDRSLQFPRERVLTIWRHGAVPSIAFLPTGGVYGPGPRRHTPEHRYTLQRIIAGVFDGQLRAWADDARALGVPLLLAFGAEVNGGWGPWNARWNGASQTDSAWNSIEAYYPGDAYVDWLGISVYGALGPRVRMTQFARKLDASGAYTTLTKLSRRPIAIVQLGTVERGTGEKAAWIRSALRTLRSGRYARVRAVVWWSMDGAASTRIDSTPEALTAFRAGVQGTSFAARLRFAGDCRPPPPDLVVATPVRTGVIRVHWSPVEVASAYEVWRDGRRVVTTKETTWLDKNARPGPSHSYHVRAVGPGGRSV
jgi:hypothetical protein